MRDVLIVGAGPAGSRLARCLAERGLDVLAFEQGTVGKPLACSGHVSTDIWGFVPDGARDRLLQNSVRGARFHPDGPGGECYRFHRDEPVSAVLDRVELDRELAAAARRAGAEIREDHTVVGLTERREYVELTVRGSDGVESYRGRLVAGCDGPNSRVRTETGLPDPDETLHGVLGFYDDPDNADFVDVSLSVPGFFCLAYPSRRGGCRVRPGSAARGRCRPAVRGVHRRLRCHDRPPVFRTHPGRPAGDGHLRAGLPGR